MVEFGERPAMGAEAPPEAKLQLWGQGDAVHPFTTVSTDILGPGVGQDDATTPSAGHPFAATSSPSRANSSPCASRWSGEASPGDAAATSAALAAREAVAEAFAALQAELLRSISASFSQLSRELVRDCARAHALDEAPDRRVQRCKTTGSHRRSKRVDSYSVGQSPSEGSLAAGSRLQPPRRDGRSMTASSNKSGMLSELRSSHSGPLVDPPSVVVRAPAPVVTLERQSSIAGSEISHASRRSGLSAVISLASHVSVASVPSVHMLQANIAGALLEQHTSFGAPARRSHKVSLRRDVSPDSSRFGVQVVPEASIGGAAVSVGVAELNAITSDIQEHHQQEEGASNANSRSDAFGSSSDGEEEPVGGIFDMNKSVSVFSMHTRAKKRRMSSSQVLKARITELAHEASQSNGQLSAPIFGETSESDHDDSRQVPLALLLLGVLPWARSGSSWCVVIYRWSVRALVALAVVAFFLPSVRLIHRGVFLPDGGAYTEVCWQRKGFMSQTPLPIAAVVVLITFGLKSHEELLDETFAVLQGVSRERKFQDWHRRQARWDQAVFACIWLCIMVATGVCNYLHCEGEGSSEAALQVLHLCLVAVFSAVILGVAYSMAFVCRSLSIMIDVFCCDVVGHNMQLRDVSHIWNLTQAVLRKASNSVEHGFLAFCFILACTVPLLVVDGGALGSSSAPPPALLPGIMLTCGVLHVLLLGAMVSEKCTRVPSLINAISFGEGTEHARQRTVDYVTSSDAGFFIFGMRLTTAMVVKFVYIWCIVAVGMLTKLASN